MPTPRETLLTQVALQDTLLKRQAERSFRVYVEEAWPILEPETSFLPNWHIDLLAEYLEVVTAGEVQYLLITVPPRSMKSLLVSILWPTWEWIQRPGGRWIFASYAEGLATKHSIDRRTVLQSAWYQARWADRVQLASDQNVKGEFQNTKRGVMLATSVGGSVTGKGGDRIVVDDLHNPQQAASDAQRETAVTYFRETLSTRRNSNKTGAIIVVMQRLHERDLAACCLDLEFTHVSLPAEAEARTEILFPRSGRRRVREPGDLLWPARDGRAELDLLQRQLGSAAYAGQYQQRPAPADGLIFERDWFQYYDELPSAYRWLQSWDMTFKGQSSADYVVGLQAVHEGADIYLVDRVKGQWTFAQTCQQVLTLRQKYPCTGEILIEDAANGPAIVNVLSRKVPGVIAVTPEGGKIARAQAAQPLVEAGNIWLPNPRPHGRLIPQREWVDDFVHQCCMFPTGAHDDDVDAFSQLVARCVQRPVITDVAFLRD